MAVAAWGPHFPTKLAAADSFSEKIGGGGKDLATLLAAVLTWSGYWAVYKELFGIFSEHMVCVTNMCLQATTWPPVKKKGNVPSIICHQ